ncbi:hypothetical protein CO115_01110 [Candidatus Falkowbacteria bacterium CG_4_9_14_3_um_filter_36_9]|uniref:RNA polymerase sigma factor 70 region 4 type 2 domain-containing protein n=2 Tax=Candidatus Falkowiibacteriota TaxID=1752728 RepID=A0A1J4TBE0_9BACT|nr:MAG: hypothetical protein AUJ27_00145 [Candidatus Falkowbacteria bacterium CG1_02_37_44]PIV51982.1 MAG: hypothetical protein COS18_01070 [Candidatus Falkowbacteria bacterium CG02_land_8_20_14_3_00_36_14]PIX10814.1 MAG: hypothetical protein COZ73_04535 [Candidatus Falkowbacteria bacterium CG_4_8_14_3_um_filter_36_11]PJA11315.1 MAG: hypothetical protein COX67_00370 [Candidatus Falkowbacteria bacterium CG_4_10_14_0_2_um_filter_36_22]PJB20522.1 MAG: hypothetical protein CO115_01110 [Candidatus F
MKASKIQEKILFSRLKGKDKDAFVKVYDLYLDNIYRFIYFKIGNETEAQDLTSTVFLKAWNYIQSKGIAEYKTLKSLIYKIARNTVIDHYRKNQNVNSISIDGERGNTDIEDKKQDIARNVEIKSDYNLIQKKLLDLKDEYREVIILYYIEEMSVGEISKILDKSRGNIRVLVFRALKALKELIEEENKK